MKIVIVGLGVIGGSYAMALKKAGYEDVYGVDTNMETLEKAKRNGLIKEGSTSGENFFKEADLTIISIYPKTIVGFIEKNRNNFKKNSIITDATGIKKMVVDKIISVIPDDVDFIPSHPMAGREKKGIDFATDKVFQGANFIITPVKGNKEKNIQLLEELVLKIGFKRVKRITTDFHDEMIGFTSQLPHAMAVALINSDEEGRDTGSFIGDSYRDLTRIANINEELWSELFLGNKENLLKCISNFQEQLELIKEAVENDDKKGLEEYFRKSTKRRESLE